MAKKKPSPKVSVVAQPAARAGIGWRWHPARFRVALCWVVAAIGFTALVGQHTALVMWFLRDAYVATRAEVVKAPYWADALDKQADLDGAIAGWHVDLAVSGKPFAIAVALADLDPGGNYVQEKSPPDAARFALGTTHPVWFMEDQTKIPARAVSLISEPPSLLVGRSAFPRLPSLAEAAEASTELLVVAGAMLAIAAVYLLLAYVGRREGVADQGRASRWAFASVMVLIAAGTSLIARDHPLAHDESYSPAEIEIVRAPFASDQLTHFRGYRVLWRTWRVEARLVNPDGPAFFIDADGLDPHRVPWASRHSPDIDAFKPGTRMPVWQSKFHSSALEGTVLSKPELYWEAFLSRERWPEKYTMRNFFNDSPQTSMFIATCIALALVCLMPLGGGRSRD
jgi:hypothetical protein